MFLKASKSFWDFNFIIQLRRPTPIPWSDMDEMCSCLKPGDSPEQRERCPGAFWRMGRFFLRSTATAQLHLSQRCLPKHCLASFLITHFLQSLTIFSKHRPRDFRSARGLWFFSIYFSGYTSDTHSQKDKAPSTPLAGKQLSFWLRLHRRPTRRGHADTCPFSKCPCPWPQTGGWGQEPGARALPVSQESNIFIKVVLFVLNSRCCSKNHILITLHVEMVQQICRTMDAHHQLLGIPPLPALCRCRMGFLGHSVIVTISAPLSYDIHSLFKPCPAPA